MMILLTGKTLPADPYVYSKVHYTTYKREIGWKVESHYQRKVNATLQKKIMKIDDVKKARQAR